MIMVIHPVRQVIKVRWIGLFLVALVLFTAPFAVMAQGMSGAGAIFRSDGTKGYFLVGSFNSKATCQDKVFKMVEYLKDQAQWVGENLTYRIHGCETAFQKGTIYFDLQNISGLKHYMLLHPNLRMLIVSPRGREAEQNGCIELTGYFESLFGQKAVCVPPKF